MLKCRKCGGLFGELSNGLCLGCKPNEVKPCPYKAKAELLSELVGAADLYCKEKLINDPTRSGHAWYDSEERDLFESLAGILIKAKAIL